MTTRRPNVLLVVVDCARAEKTVTEIGDASPGTRRSAPLPALEALRDRGTTWTQYCSVSSTTTPNFATMFTGLTPKQHGIAEHSRHTLHDVPTVAEILRANGYHTLAEVTGPLIPPSGLGRGFHEYRHRDRSRYFHLGFGDELAARIHALPEPWFACVHLWEAHAPYQNPAPFHTRGWGDTPYDRALSLADHHVGHLLGHLDASRTTVVFCGDHGERLEQDYAQNAASGGQELRVLECYRSYLAAHSGPMNFDAWFDAARADLGEPLARIYAHNVLGHGFHLTEDLVRVPLVIAGDERCVPGITNAQLASQVDLAATLLDLAGVDASLPGMSLLTQDEPATIYVEANGSGGKAHASRCYLRGVRTARWKYWRLEGGSVPHVCLWDLESDPRETRNVSEVYPDVAQQLDRETALWTERKAAGAAGAITPDEERLLEETLKGLGYL